VAAAAVAAVVTHVWNVNKAAVATLCALRRAFSLEDLAATATRVSVVSKAARASLIVSSRAINRDKHATSTHVSSVCKAAAVTQIATMGAISLDNLATAAAGAAVAVIRVWIVRQAATVYRNPSKAIARMGAISLEELASVAVDAAEHRCMVRPWVGTIRTMTRTVIRSTTRTTTHLAPLHLWEGPCLTIHMPLGIRQTAVCHSICVWTWNQWVWAIHAVKPILRTRMTKKRPLALSLLKEF